MRGLVSPMPLRRSYRTKFRVFSGEAYLPVLSAALAHHRAYHCVRIACLCIAAPDGISRITRTGNGKMSDYMLKHTTAFDMETFLHG